MSVVNRVELQELVEQFYTKYVYDNFSPDFEREFVQEDTKGGNCVYLSRLFLQRLKTDERFDFDKCQLLVAKKHRDGNDNKPLNHVLVLYDNYVVELAGASSGVVAIGSDYELHKPVQYLYKAMYSIADKDLIQVFRMKPGGTEVQTPIDASLLHPYSTNDGDKPYIKELKRSIAEAKEAKYQVRFATGQTMILLRVEKVDDVNLPFNIHCGIGRYNKKNKYVAPQNPQPAFSFNYTMMDWHQAVNSWLEEQLVVMKGSINLQHVMESLTQWLSKYTKV